MKKLIELKKKLMINNDCQKLILIDFDEVKKTQIALKFAYTMKKRWLEYFIFWISTLSVESFEQTYKDIATKCFISLNFKKENSKKSIQRYLNNDSTNKWFFVVDNLNDQKTLFKISSELKKCKNNF